MCWNCGKNHDVKLCPEFAVALEIQTTAQRGKKYLIPAAVRSTTLVGIRVGPLVKWIEEKSGHPGIGPTELNYVVNNYSNNIVCYNCGAAGHLGGGTVLGDILCCELSHQSRQGNQPDECRRRGRFKEYFFLPKLCENIFDSKKAGEFRSSIEEACTIFELDLINGTHEGIFGPYLCMHPQVPLGMTFLQSFREEFKRPNIFEALKERAQTNMWYDRNN